MERGVADCGWPDPAASALSAVMRDAIGLFTAADTATGPELCGAHDPFAAVGAELDPFALHHRIYACRDLIAGIEPGE